MFFFLCFTFRADLIGASAFKERTEQGRSWHLRETKQWGRQLRQKRGKKKFALLMSDPLMDWFRGYDDELCPRIDANLSCESFSEHYMHAALYIALSFIKRDSLSSN